LQAEHGTVNEARRNVDAVTPPNSRSKRSFPTASDITYLVFPVDNATQTQLKNTKKTLTSTLSGKERWAEIPIDNASSILVGLMKLAMAIKAVGLDGRTTNNDPSSIPICRPSNATKAEKDSNPLRMRSLHRQAIRP